ncbi:hypothetical protein ACHHYP_15127 [Achlya hypogyna]|uniref:Uncharacterized protein n=1 Tax=Achlya hypogyna TaxID=1202772 RepID=A0A1V9ZEZ5_ACHHY|nr:hypothetical protein ACHHYP_15127 [Achlya hypogyna]
MSTSKAEKFVRLLSAKLNELPQAPAQDELRAQLETAVASLPNSALKGLLQRDLDHYAALLQQNVVASATAPTSDRCLAEQEYDLLLQATHAAKLVELPVTPAEFFCTHSVPSPVDAAAATPSELVDAVAQYTTALAHELATNGLVSALPSQQEPGHAVALYVGKILPYVQAWLAAGGDGTGRLHALLLDTLQLVQFHRPLPPQAAPDLIAFYTPSATTEVAARSAEAAAIAELYACALVLALFFPPPADASAAADADSDSDSDADDVTVAAPTPDAIASQLLADARAEAPAWLVDVALLALSLPRPAGTASKDHAFTRVVLQALRAMRFEVGMGRQAFLKHIACLRLAKEYLKAARLGHSKELTALTTQLTSMPVPFKLLDWLRVVALSAVSTPLRTAVSAVLAVDSPMAGTFLNSTWTDATLHELTELVQEQFASADTAAILDESAPAAEPEQPLFFVDNTGGH